MSHEASHTINGYSPEAMPKQPLPEGAVPPGDFMDTYDQTAEAFEASDNPFDQNPNLAMDTAVDQLFVVADQQVQEQMPGDSPLEEDDQTRKKSGYDGVAVDIGTGEFLSVERLADTDRPLPGKPRTIITKPVEKGSYNGVEYSQTERYIEGPDGTWRKEVGVELGAGADAVFGTSNIHEEVPLDMDDMRSVHDTVYRPNNVRKLRHDKPQVAGSGANLSQRATA